MKIKVIGSGSKGNCTIIQSKNTTLMIDVGINYQRIEKELSKEKISVNEIDGILITHSHNDHVKGLKTFISKINTKIYIPRGMVNEIASIVSIDNIEIIEDLFSIRDISIELLHTSHDTPCSVGYILENNNKSIVYITDTGYLNKRILDKIKNKTMYFIESNHDEKMLMEGPYPEFLKRRVISDEGHLSNNITSKSLLKVIGPETVYIILAHISEHNNTKELAYSTTYNLLKENNIDKKILVANQDESLDLIEV